ncbi:NAD-binding protein [Mycena venus]|uniref:NAD-binding protein n=1 Tax=Mycena venus TaxID=2733690 RepID=A0A8H6XRD2_9AGAR|nr:NAD-binding protein [Mycena venus]
MSSRGIALVTGAGQGIGKAIALRLANDGLDVAVNDIPCNTKNLAQVVDEIKAIGRAASSHIADVSIENEVKNMVEEVVRVHAGLDVMVANAGVCKWASIPDTTVEEWDRMMAINARGTFLCYKYAGIQMVSQGRGGRIIGAASVAGKKGTAFTSAYCSSKFAVRGLTQAAAMEFGSHGITVNAYAPGIIETEMMRYIDQSHADTTGGTPGAFIKLLKETAGPLGKNGTPNDIAGLVSYIASKESQFITGQSISINGGMFFD